MTLNAYEASAGVFIRGLTNLKRQLTTAEAHAAATGGGPAEMLDARLATGSGAPDPASRSPRDVHAYTLAQQVHWAAEGARLAIARLLDVRAVPAPSDATSFADLHERIDATLAHLREIEPGDLEAGLERTVVIEHPRGSVRSSGDRFLLGYAIPHFLYHVAAAYGICRNQGVQLTMGDFLGDWAAG